MEASFHSLAALCDAQTKLTQYPKLASHPPPRCQLFSVTAAAKRLVLATVRWCYSLVRSSFVIMPYRHQHYPRRRPHSIDRTMATDSMQKKKKKNLCVCVPKNVLHSSIERNSSFKEDHQEHEKS